MSIEDMYASWNLGFIEAYDTAVEVLNEANPPEIDGLAVCGMGGSGAGGDYLSALAPGKVAVAKSFKPLPLKGYGVVAVSYSGNTWETLRCMAAAVSEYEMPVIAVVTSGGRLNELSEKLGIPRIVLPRGLLPRAAFGHILGSLLGIASYYEIVEISKDVIKRVVERGVDVFDAERWAETWAPRLASAESIAFIGCESTAPLATRAKNEFAENSKLPGRLEIYPESAHNDIEALGRPLSHYIAFKPLSSPCKDVVEAAVELHRDEGACGVEQVIDDGSPASLLEDMMRVTLRIGLASVKTGRLRGVNPEATTRIARYKEKMGGLGSR